MGRGMASVRSKRFRDRAEQHHHRPGLRKGTRHLVNTAVLTLLGRTDDLADCLDWAVGRRVQVSRLVEAILQAHLFGGFPRAIHALEVLDDVLVSRGVGTEPDLDRIPPRVSLVAYFRRRGRDLFGEIYRDDAGPVTERIARFHPEFMEWITEFAYGRVLARPFLELSVREILAASMLTVLDLPRQLTPHLRGALRSGASVREVGEALRQLELFVRKDRVKQALVRLDRARTTI